MMLGREVTLPLDLLMGRPPQRGQESVNAYVEKHNDHLHKVHEMAMAQPIISGKNRRKSMTIGPVAKIRILGKDNWSGIIVHSSRKGSAQNYRTNGRVHIK